MLRINKSNGRETLIKTCDNFHKRTGEVVGIVTTWKGTLTVLGPEQFRNLISAQKDAIWCSLSPGSVGCTNEPSYTMQQTQDLLGKDVSTYTTQMLRRIVSSIVKEAVGRHKRFWEVEELKPVWWPKYIPFVCVSKSTKYRITKKQLIEIVVSYKRTNNMIKTNEAESSTDTHFSTSTPIKRQSLLESSTYLSPPKRSLEISIDDDSYFNGLLDQSSHSHSIQQILPPLNYILPSLNKVSPSMKKVCLTELSTQGQLTDTSIYVFCNILKNCFPLLNGLQDTLFSQNLSFKKMPRDELSVQVHHSKKNHWVCSSSDSVNGVRLYDSMFQGITATDIDTQLALLNADKSMQLEVQVPKIQHQLGWTDCGLFAAAVVTALATGSDPVYLTWTQANMREHMHKCIEREVITPFPSITRGKRTGKVPIPQRYTIECICDCNLPEFAYAEDGNEYSIQCDTCNFWFHNHCYNLPNTSISDYFQCNNCRRI